MTDNQSSSRPDIVEPPSAERLFDVPRVTLTPRNHVYRVHGRGREPNYFSTDRFGRFNPPPGNTDFGTCYCSASDDGAFVEALCRDVPVVSASDVSNREITSLTPAADLDLADLTNPLVLGQFGLTATISAGGPSVYGVCQRWAAALFAIGLKGIRYRARHDPSMSSVSYAIFGGPGVDDKPLTIQSTQALWPIEHLNETLERFGIHILPPAVLP